MEFIERSLNQADAGLPDTPQFSARQKEDLATCIDFICQHGLVPVLPAHINPQIILRKDLKRISIGDPGLESQRAAALRMNVHFLMTIFEHNDKIQLTTALEYLLVVFLASVCTISVSASLPEDVHLAEKMLTTYDGLVIKEKHVKALLLLKSFPGQPLEYAQWIHRRLLKCLQSAGGLQALAINLLSGSDDKVPLWSKCETIGKIVAAKGHTKAFYSSIVEQLKILFRLAVKENDQRFIAVSISCFNQLIAINREEIHKSIEEIFTEKWRLLSKPEDILAGLCVLDETEIRSEIEMNFVAFRGSQLSSLKTQVIQKFIPLLFQLGSLLRDSSDERRKIEGIVVHSMANREKAELKSIVENILFPSEGNFDYFSIHQRVGVKYHCDSSFSINILTEEEADKVSDAALELVRLMKGSNNNILIFNVFMEILKIFDEVMSSDDDQAAFDSQLVQEEDAEVFLARAFKRKCVIVSTLAELITHKPFHFQFAENSSEILKFINNLLRRKTEGKIGKSDEQVLILIFSIFREFIGGQAERFIEEVDEIKLLARKLKGKCTELPDLRSKIEFFLSEWEDKEDARDHLSKFEMAKELCTNKEPYLRVYGMKEMMSLIKSKDAETMANLHSILLGALVYIKDEDSYSFLASIQLLVLLTRHLEGTVIETLVVEFQDASTSMDYRLKIGEAIVKTVEGLGIFAVKYKEMFINCFLRGIEDKCSTDEYRVSCIFNLGQICKFLSYQVHNFFNELISTLKMVLEQDPYLPSRRAAALLLVDLLRGVDNLIDFQEFLLPFYRLLKHICSNDEDERTRIHANTGLTILHDKIKEALTPKERMEKEIRILGVETEGDKIMSLFPK